MAAASAFFIPPCSPGSSARLPCLCADAYCPDREPCRGRCRSAFPSLFPIPSQDAPRSTAIRATSPTTLEFLLIPPGNPQNTRCVLSCLLPSLPPVHVPQHSSSRVSRFQCCIHDHPVRVHFTLRSNHVLIFYKAFYSSYTNFYFGVREVLGPRSRGVYSQHLSSHLPPLHILRNHLQVRSAMASQTSKHVPALHVLCIFQLHRHPVVRPLLLHANPSPIRLWILQWPHAHRERTSPRRRHERWLGRDGLFLQPKSAYSCPSFAESRNFHRYSPPAHCLVRRQPAFWQRRNILHLYWYSLRILPRHSLRERNSGSMACYRSDYQLVSSCSYA